MHRLDAWLDDIFGHPVDVRRHAHLIVRLVEWRARESGDPGEIAGRAAEALRTTGAVVAAARLNRLRTTSTNASRARRGYADLGHLLGRQRELDEAERLLQAALHLASDAPLDRAMVLRRLAVIRHKQGHYEDAATLLMEARRLLDTRKSTGFDRAARERSRVNREAATVARRSDRIDEAVAILLESDRQLQALPSSRNVLAERARVARQLGRCSLRLDDVVAARARYAEASSLALRTDEFQVQALVTRDSTEVNIRLGLFEEALSTSATAHQLAVERNEPAGVGDGLEARGRASFAVGDLHAAESFFDQALEQYRSIAGHDGESGARIGLAEVAAARGLTEFARSLLPRVVDGINGIADYRTLRVHLRLSDRDHEAATRIAAVAEERSLPSIRAAALGAAAVSIATSDTTRAESYLEPAFAIAGSHPSFETEILLHGCATRVLLAKGQVVPAAGQAEAARLMIASVTRPMSAENAIKLEAKYRPILALADALEFLPGTDALERRWTGYFG